MKNVKIFFAVLGFAFLTNLNVAQAQIDATISPLGLFWGNIKLGADFAIKPGFSVEANLGFDEGSVAGVDFTSVPVNAFAKFYMNPKNGADRFYIGGFARYVNRNYKGGNEIAAYKASKAGLGFGLGYKIVGKRGFVFDVAFGAGRAIVNTSNITDNNGNTESLEWNNFMTYSKLGIGYRF